MIAASGSAYASTTSVSAIPNHSRRLSSTCGASSGPDSAGGSDSASPETFGFPIVSTRFPMNRTVETKSSVPPIAIWILSSSNPPNIVG